MIESDRSESDAWNLCDSADPLYWMRGILASNGGSLMELGARAPVGRETRLTTREEGRTRFALSHW